MRKLVIVVVALALLIVLLARVVLGPSTKPIEPRDEPASPLAPAASDLESTHAAPTEQRSPLDSAARAANVPAATTPVESAGSLRIRVQMVPADRTPKDVTVSACDVNGDVRQALRDGPLEFVIPALAPGAYAIVGKEAGSVTAWARAQVTLEKETRVDLALDPRPHVRVRWRTSDGQPIANAVVALVTAERPTVFKLLRVVASNAPARFEGPAVTAISLAEIRQTLRSVRDGEEVRVQQLERALTGETESETKDDLFGTLDVPARRPLWISAWVDGVLLACQRLPDDQDEVVFTSAPSDLDPDKVPVSFCFVDDATNQPISNASVRVNDSYMTLLDQRGCGRIRAPPGKLTLQLQRITSPTSDIVEAGSPWTLSIDVHAGQPLQLGEVRVSWNMEAQVRVIDEHSQPRERVEVVLRRAGAVGESTLPFAGQSQWTDANGLATFRGLSSDHYILTCTTDHLDANPIVLDRTRAVPADAVPAMMVVHPARRVSIVFTEQPLPRTLVVVATREDLPARVLDVDEFGVVPMWLAGTDYSVHLVEQGDVSPAVTFHVDADPFVLEIRR